MKSERRTMQMLKMSTCTFLRLLVTFCAVVSACILGCVTPVVEDPYRTGRAAWPMWQHDFRHSGRGMADGPSRPHVRWKFRTDGYISSAPVVGADDRVFVTSTDSKLYAINHSGRRMWELCTDGLVDNCLAIGKDGSVYYGTQSGRFAAVHPSGVKKWDIQLSGKINDACVVDEEGCIWVVANSILHVISPLGVANSLCESQGTPTIGEANALYTLTSGVLTALTSSGRVKWKRGAKICATPSIQNDTVFFSSGSAVHSLKPHDMTGWSLQLLQSPVSASIAVGPEGILYVPTFNALCACTSGGALAWTFPIAEDTCEEFRVPPIIDGSGWKIYIGTHRGKLYAIDRTGKLRWSLDFDEEIRFSGAIGKDGTLYVPAGEHLSAIGEQSNECGETVHPQCQTGSELKDLPKDRLSTQLPRHLKMQTMQLVHNLGNDKYIERVQATAELTALLAAPSDQWVLLAQFLYKLYSEASDEECKHNLRVLLTTGFGPWEYYTNLHILKGHSDSITTVSFNSDGSLFASGSIDRTVRVWDSNTGECLRVLSGHRDSVSSVAFNPKKDYLASASEDGSVRIWDVDTGRCTKTIEADMRYAYCIEFSGDGGLLASGGHDGVVRLWDPETGVLSREMPASSGRIVSLAFSPSSSMLAVSYEFGDLLIWDYSTGKVINSLKQSERILCSREIAFSSCGELLSCVDAWSGHIMVFAMDTGLPVCEIQGQKRHIYSLDFAPIGRTLAIAGQDQIIKLYDSTSGKPLKDLVGQKGDINSLCFAPNSGILASGSDDGTVIVWGIHEDK